MTDKDVKILSHAEFAALSAELIDNSDGLRFRARGGSMLPTIADGDVLTIEKADIGSLRLGDIVLIQNDGSMLAHRIIKKKKTTCTTCGDALSMHDEPFGAEQLIGRVVWIEHDNINKPVSRICGLWRSRLRRLIDRLTSRL